MEILLQLTSDFAIVVLISVANLYSRSSLSKFEIVVFADTKICRKSNYFAGSRKLKIDKLTELKFQIHTLLHNAELDNTNETRIQMRILNARIRISRNPKFTFDMYVKSAMNLIIRMT